MIKHFTKYDANLKLIYIYIRSTSEFSSRSSSTPHCEIRAQNDAQDEYFVSEFTENFSLHDTEKL